MQAGLGSLGGHRRLAVFQSRGPVGQMWGTRASGASDLAVRLGPPVATARQAAVLIKVESPIRVQWFIDSHTHCCIASPLIMTIAVSPALPETITIGVLGQLLASLCLPS